MDKIVSRSSLNACGFINANVNKSSVCNVPVAGVPVVDCWVAAAVVFNIDEDDVCKPKPVLLGVPKPNDDVVWGCCPKVDWPSKLDCCVVCCCCCPPNENGELVVVAVEKSK